LISLSLSLSLSSGIIYFLGWPRLWVACGHPRKKK
jgi:hypothetical protein